MEILKLKKGLDIQISGSAIDKIVPIKDPPKVAIFPEDFYGITPKMAVKVGDQVKIGSPLFHDKKQLELNVVSPISGKIVDIVRGERRKLLSVVIENDKQNNFESLRPITLNGTKEDLLKTLLNSGFAGFFRQRPYDVLVNFSATPKAIFVSAFDSNPLANDYNISLKGQGKMIQAGLDLLNKLAPKVYYSIGKNTSAELSEMKGVEINKFEGPHPVGNVGVQINHLNPINKDEFVWTINLQDLALLGQFVLTGKPSFTKTIALVGPMVKDPQYFKTVIGTPIASIVKGHLDNSRKLRLINGSVLCGKQTSENDYLMAKANEISVIAEGDDTAEMFGWIRPRLNKFSLAHSLPGRFFRKHFDFDARILGGQRAFIMSGEYEKVFPMDIYPEQLVKAMIAKNIDKMEMLGAYEVAPEDFAVCEYVCTSKIETQAIVREALDFMKKELE